MKRFLITSPKFNGEAEVHYNERGTLSCIDLRNTDMDEMTVAHFKHATPATLTRLLSPGPACSFSHETVIVEAEFEVTFELFYKDYPYKRNAYKVRAQFEKMNKSDKVKAFYSLHEYKKFLSRTGCFAMIGDRYLKDKEFETDWKKVQHRS